MIELLLILVIGIQLAILYKMHKAPEPKVDVQTERPATKCLVNGKVAVGEDIPADIQVVGAHETNGIVHYVGVKESY